MRITGGTACGRRLAVPTAGVRPSQDRLRESLFSMLAPHLPGAHVLDLFAGSGALGLEAWSRGAASVCWVERSPRVFRTLRANVESIAGKESAGLHCLVGDACRPLRFSAFGPFTLVLADPPYEHGRGGDLVRRLLQSLAEPTMVASGGRTAIEQAATEPAAESRGWHLERDRVLGQSRVVVYRRDTTPGEGENT